MCLWRERSQAVLPVRQETANEFCGNMLRICCTAAIPEKQNFLVLSQRIRYFPGRFSDERRLCLKELRLHANTLRNELRDEALGIIHKM
jgi:hypothetical protein